MSEKYDRPSNHIVLGRHCSKCFHVCLDDWKFCPMCGNTERYGDRFRCYAPPQPGAQPERSTVETPAELVCPHGVRVVQGVNCLCGREVARYSCFIEGCPGNHLSKHMICSAVEPTRRIPPREFDVETHTGLYTEPEKASEQPRTPVYPDDWKKPNKVGCKNFQLRGGEYCGNCGFHASEHDNI